MDDNLSEVVTMAGMALLFIVAISHAILSYNSLADNVELFTDTNLLGVRSSVASEDLESTYETRKATRAEVIMAVAGIGRQNSTGQRNDYTVKFNTHTCEFKDNKIVIDGTLKYDPDLEESLSNLISELKRLLPDSSATFHVSYADGEIIYIAV